ncbi:MAG TPA: DUF2946 family protein [Paraburkholderia sp.]|nr:DUF2946 family protein [Paraburkholderia sp.]
MTAWLGLLALWLGLVAPVVTQMLAARERAASFDSTLTGWSADLCSTRAPQADTALADHSHRTAQRHDTHDTHDTSCGYCGLLAHHLPVAGGVVHVPDTRGTYALAVPRRALDFRPVEPYSPCRPRGPPAGVSAFV